MNMYVSFLKLVIFCGCSISFKGLPSWFWQFYMPTLESVRSWVPLFHALLTFSLSKEVGYITSMSFCFFRGPWHNQLTFSQLLKTSWRARPCRRKLVAFSGLSLFYFTGLSHVRLGFTWRGICAWRWTQQTSLLPWSQLLVLYSAYSELSPLSISPSVSFSRILPYQWLIETFTLAHFHPYSYFSLSFR